MKKFLLFATLLLALIVPAKAAEVTFVMADIYSSNAPKDGTATEWGNGVSAITTKGGSTATAYNANGKDLRLYSSNTITIKSPEKAMEKIVFNISTQGLKRLAEITATEGTIDTQASGDKTVVWTGNATEVTFTVGAKAIYGSESSSAGQFDFTEVAITFSDEGVAVVAPAFSVTSGIVKSGTEVELTCATEGASIYYTIDGTEPTNESTLYTKAITIDKDMTIKAIAYKGEEKSDVVTAAYTIEVVVEDIADAITYGNGEKFTYAGDLTVVYKNGLNIYVYDGKDYTLVYGSVTCEAGDVLKGGWTAEVSIYGGMFEIKPSTTPTVEGTATVPSPTEITSENIASLYVPTNVNGYYVIKNVTFEAATPSTKANQTVEVDETSVVFRNNFTIASVEAGTYDVVGFIGIYDTSAGTKELSTDPSKLQFFPIEYKAADTSSINGVEVDENAPVQYYNLSGMPISNPAAGQVVIRVQGGKANKIHF